MKTKMLAYVVVGLFVVSAALGLFNYQKTSSLERIYDELQGFDLVCIAEQCAESVSGDAWATTYCKPNADSTSLDCTFQVEGKTVVIPLSQINTSNLKSCIRKECAAQILVKGKSVEEVIRE